MGKRFSKGILSHTSWQIKDNEVTPEEIFTQRRSIIKALGLGAVGATFATSARADIFDLFGTKKPIMPFVTEPLKFTSNASFNLKEASTPYNKVISHNNFYEFGTDKQDPVNNAQAFRVQPWQLVIDGLVDNPITLDYDDLTSLIALEERTYRLRCVEAWSMVIPWTGFSLATLLKKVGVKSSASHVAFQTLYDPSQMPGQRNRRIGGGVDFPYIEGLTIDEAMNELSFLSVGVYGKTLPPQNGAPIRLVVPWKYGFKSIKSIVRITLTDKQPPTSWNLLAPNEYGFYANVNPAVDHPRWSQASERRIGQGGLFSAKRIPTLPFNGYGEQVASLYKGINLTQYF